MLEKKKKFFFFSDSDIVKKLYIVIDSLTVSSHLVYIPRYFSKTPIFEVDIVQPRCSCIKNKNVEVNMGKLYGDMQYKRRYILKNFFFLKSRKEKETFNLKKIFKLETKLNFLIRED